MKSFVLLTLSLAILVGAHAQTDCRAIVRMSDPSGQTPVHGNVTFTQLQDGKVRVQGTIEGLPPGLYGFHVHEKGDITGGCMSTKSHFNPHKMQHGSPNDSNRHVGDLGNIEFDESNIANLDFVDSMLALQGERNIIGRALVLHAQEDDLGRTNHKDSRTTGNAGGRVACGVIGILDPVTGCSNGASIAVLAPSILLVASLLLLLR